jgi:hypothetical protein
LHLLFLRGKEAQRKIAFAPIPPPVRKHAARTSVPCCTAYPIDGDLIRSLFLLLEKMHWLSVTERKLCQQVPRTRTSELVGKSNPNQLG